MLSSFILHIKNKQKKQNKALGPDSLINLQRQLMKPELEPDHASCLICLDSDLKIYTH